nr:squalene/phytoene synthase family protein [uncultured Sphingomonas sp.]
MRDLDLVRHYWPEELRPAFDALFAIDEVLADIVATSTQPALGAIRLAWWREALERLDEAPAPAEPRLQAVAAELLPRGVAGKALAAIEDGYAALLDEQIDAERVASSGEALFQAAATVLGVDDVRVADAGRLYGLVRSARRGLMAIPEDADASPLFGYRFPRGLRPLTALARLAVRDIRRAPNLETEATPARAVSLISHRLFGMIG